MYKSRVEILHDFYNATKTASEVLPDFQFVNSVSKAWNDCRVLLQGCKEDMDHVVIDWKKEALEKFYQDIGFLWEDSNPNFLRTAPVIRNAIAWCANEIGNYVAIKIEDSSFDVDYHLLECKPGDTLVIAIDVESRRQYAELCREISDTWKEAMPGVKFLFLPVAAQISAVVRIEENPHAD